MYTCIWGKIYHRYHLGNKYKNIRAVSGESRVQYQRGMGAGAHKTSWQPLLFYTFETLLLKSCAYTAFKIIKETVFDCPDLGFTKTERSGEGTLCGLAF